MTYFTMSQGPIDAHLAGASPLVERTTQAILARAFRSEL